MRMLVVHDELGNIKSAAIAPGAANLKAGLRPQRGEFVAELEAEDIDPEDLRRNPGMLRKNFRIDPATGTLIRKHREPIEGA